MGPRNKCGDDNFRDSFLKLAHMGLVPATHGSIRSTPEQEEKWVAGTNPAMTGWRMIHRLPNEGRVYAVYTLASKRNGTFYIGVTGDLISRIAQHKAGDVKGFTQRYKVHTLV